MSRLDFIVFSDDWGRHPFSCQHIVQRLLPHNRVLWVNTIGMRRPRVTMADLRRSVQKIRSYVTPKEGMSLPDNLSLLSPPMLPFGNKAVRAFNRRSVVSNVRNKARELGFSSPVLLTTLPNASEYIGLLDESLAVYYCVDDFTLWPGVNRRLVAEMEQRLLIQADLLFCSSGALASLKRRPGLRTEILPHGVDYPHFSRAARGQVKPLPALTKIRRPVVGYFGLLGEWVDVGILEAIATARPEWSLLLMGKVVADTWRLADLPNVRFTGPVPYVELPDYVAHVDVLIIPYHTGGRGQSITPLKLRECIATGKPVVSTAIPECTQYAPHIAIAEGGGGFIAAIEQALLEAPEKGPERMRLVAGESWEERARFLSSCISEALQEKGTGRASL